MILLKGAGKPLAEVILRRVTKQKLFFFEKDKAKIIDLISRSYTLKQGDKDILTYSNELRAIHIELDHCYPQSTDPLARAREATN